MTVVAKHRSWTKRERHLYANQAVRATGAVDKGGRLEMEFLSGPLAGERRWMSTEELQLNAADEIDEETTRAKNPRNDR